jgi:hypothetical protein
LSKYALPIHYQLARLPNTPDKPRVMELHSLKVQQRGHSPAMALAFSLAATISGYMFTVCLKRLWSLPLDERWQMLITLISFLVLLSFLLPRFIRISEQASLREAKLLKEPEYQAALQVLLRVYGSTGL